MIHKSFGREVECLVCEFVELEARILKLEQYRDERIDMLEERMEHTWTLMSNHLAESVE